MNMGELIESLKEKRSLYYNNKPVCVVEIYEIFNLIDIRYMEEDTVFTIDVSAIQKQKSKEIRIRIV
ncbi:MAG: hypothetical protein ACLSH8_04045 [Zhenhengia sp.]|uniref:hypothetical protein n=1 Tax=Zhenhengia sp. TaxID=2944208 RepID=UPI0039918D6C